MWSIGNETTQGTSCGDAAGATRAAALLTELHKVAKAEDPSRKTTLASNKNNDKIAGISDD